MNVRSRQDGFGALEGLLIIVIVAILGFTGYYVWHAQKNTAKTVATTTSSSQSSTAKAADTTAAKYLTISEWSVKIPLPAASDTADIYYRISDDVSGGSSAILGSRKLTAVEPNCDVSNDSASSPFGVILRQTAAEHAYAATDPEGYGDANPATPTKLGDYYYGFSSSEADCAPPANTAAVKLESNLDNLPQLTEAIKSIQAL